MTLTFHGVFFSFTLISLLLQVLGQTDNWPTKYRHFATWKCYLIFDNKISCTEEKAECENLNSSLAEFEDVKEAYTFISNFYNFPTENHHLALGKCYILFDNKLFWTESKAECESLISTVAEFKDIKEAYTFISNVYNCPTEYHYFALGKCYIIFVNRLSWTEAKAECESLNSSLAELEDIKEAYTFINYEANFWIGVYDYKPEQSWVWISDNKTVNMSYWNDLSEYLINETCGLLFFYDVPNIHGDYCDSLEYFICMSLPVVSTVTISTTEAPATTTLSTTEAPTTTTTSTTETPATTTLSTTEAPTTTTTSTTEAPTTTTTSTTETPTTTTTSRTEAPATTTTSTTEVPATNTTSTTEAPDTTTTSTTEAQATTTTSTTEAPATTTTTSSEETTSTSSQMSTYSSSQTPTTSPTTTMSTITNLNSRIGNTLETTTQGRENKKKLFLTIQSFYFLNITFYDNSNYNIINFAEKL